MTRLSHVSVAFLAACAAFVAASAVAQDPPPALYDATEWRAGDSPDSDGDGFPDNVASLCWQCLSTSEWGDSIAIDTAATGGSSFLGNVVVAMSSWSPHSEWIDDYPDPAGYLHPITLTLYELDDSGPEPAIGPVIAEVTEDVLVPWRPEDPDCPVNPTFGVGWGDSCTFGKLFEAVFDLSDLALELPSELVYGIALNTQTWGRDPIGVPGPYNSLNVGVVNIDWSPQDGVVDADPNPAVGSTGDDVFWASQFPCCGQDGTFKPSNVLAGCCGASTLAVRLESGRRTVRIDLRPNNTENQVNTNSRQLVPIAVLSDEDFDAVSELDDASVRVRGEDSQPVTTRTEIADIDGDGLLDKVLYFRARRMEDPTPEECADPDAKILLTGVDMTGRPLAGTDSVTWLGPACD